MFVGHYGISFALKYVEPRASLAALFVGVQFLDVIFFPLTLAGVERFALVENHTQSTHFNLLYMPFSHSMMGALLWAVAAFLVVRLFTGKPPHVANKVAAVIAVAVASHWFLDLIVHTPDLPLSFGTGEKYGLGLWNNALATYVLEAFMLAAGLVLYMKAAGARRASAPKIARYGMPLFVLLLLMVNVFNLYGPLSPQDTVESTAVTVLTVYFLFALIAWWLDKMLPNSRRPLFS